MRVEGAKAVFLQKVVLINVNRTGKKRGLDLYDAVRYSWRVSRARAEKADYVLAVLGGEIIGVFEAEEWLPATKENFRELPDDYGRWHSQGWDPANPKRRWGFRGREAPDDIKNL
jgi:hypothetical protein